jgi:hypothetical protein
MVYMGGNPELVQYQNQENGREELWLSNVHLQEGA